MHSQREKGPNPLSIPLQTLDVFCAEACAGMAGTSFGGEESAALAKK